MEVVVSSKTLPLKPPGDADPAVTVAAAVAAAKSASPRHEWLWRKETAMDGSWCVSRGWCDVRWIFHGVFLGDGVYGIFKIIDQI